MYLTGKASENAWNCFCEKSAEDLASQTNPVFVVKNIVIMLLFHAKIHRPFITLEMRKHPNAGIVIVLTIIRMMMMSRFQMR